MGRLSVNLKAPPSVLPYQKRCAWLLQSLLSRPKLRNGLGPDSGYSIVGCRLENAVDKSLLLWLHLAPLVDAGRKLGSVF